jgi:hypothetical protein
MRALHRPDRGWLAVVLALVGAGCAGQRDDAALDAQRRMLSEGYTMLYVDAGHLAMVRAALYFKVESDPVEEVVGAVADFGGELEHHLERIAKDYPGVRIDLEPLPEIERRKRRAIGFDKVRDFLPLVGRSGRAFERTLLIALFNGINHESHLCAVMADEEPDPGLRKFLLASAVRYRALGTRIDALLEKEYYKDPDGPSAG